MEFKFAFSNPVAIRLSSTFAFDVICSEHRLFKFHLRERNKWKAKWLHLFFLILGIKNHSMCCQINSSSLASNEFCLFLSMKFNRNIIAEQQYTEKNIRLRTFLCETFTCNFRRYAQLCHFIKSIPCFNFALDVVGMYVSKRHFFLSYNDGWQNRLSRKKQRSCIIFSNAWKKNHFEFQLTQLILTRTT